MRLVVYYNPLKKKKRKKEKEATITSRTKWDKSGLNKTEQDQSGLKKPNEWTEQN